MNTVFIGGSRHVSRLPLNVRERLDNVIENGLRVVVGDANGADKAVQKHFFDAAYEKVTVFCSGNRARNNLGQWQTQSVVPPRGEKGFQFYAAKDREMAREADFGFMIWDGKSPGTMLNVLRLVRAGKKALVMNVPDKTGTTFRTAGEWSDFLQSCSVELRADLRSRALPDEWAEVELGVQPTLLDGLDPATPVRKMEPAPLPTDDELATAINTALASIDASSFVDALGNIARAQGMTRIAKESGLSRESLYRSLGSGGNPEFATVLKIMAVIGFRLEATRAEDNFPPKRTKARTTVG